MRRNGPVRGRRDMDRPWPAPGAYLLPMTIAQPLSLRIRTLTPAVLPPGRYVYAGNARGRGGIRARVKPHLRRRA